MYKRNQTQEEINEYIKLNNRLKKENQDYKRIANSLELRIGTLFKSVIDVFKNRNGLVKLAESIDASLRWKIVCRKYPISHLEKNGCTEGNYFSDERIVVYTAIFGAYDIPLEPIITPDNCEFVIITDQLIPEESIWNVIKGEAIIPDYDNLTNAERNRYCKMFPHIIFPNTRFTIYIDGNIQVISDITEFINHDYKHGMQFHRHKARKCVYDELEACRALKKTSKEAAEEYKEYLHKNNFPKNFGMVECNVIVRDNTNQEMCSIMKEWWDEYHGHSVKRDQLSLPFLFWRHGIRIEEICELGYNVEDNSAIRVIRHK